MDFPNYDTLTQILRDLSQRHSRWMRIVSLGKSFEGRDIWLAILTDRESGSDEQKPALWIDGNIHATELTPTLACLHMIQTLVRDVEHSETIRQLLKKRVFYICPRVNPDGAEWALNNRWIRSSTRPYPYAEEPLEGFVQEDVDGDGRILWMKIPDPNGPWKVSQKDPRLLVLREPTETQGEFFRLLPEGKFLNYDGLTFPPLIRQQGLDLNRNFPIQWAPESVEPGAGEYPTSEPEVRAVVEFISKHSNLIGAISFHTYSGVLLRPYSFHPDEHFAAEDLWTYQKIGKYGEKWTGYPALSCYHDFRYHPKEVTHGAFDDWAYEERGIFSWTVEIWSPMREAGIEVKKIIDWFREHPEEDDLKLLKWNDEVLNGQGFVSWYAFKHPQLGAIELGGWDHFNVLRNPPKILRQREVERFPKWLIWHLSISPLLDWYDAQIIALDRGVWKVQVVVENKGWLPTYVTQKALEKKLTRGVILTIDCPNHVHLESGSQRVIGPELEGRAYKPTAYIGMPRDYTHDRWKYTWILRTDQEDFGEIVVQASHPRAGKIVKRFSQNFKIHSK